MRHPTVFEKTIAGAKYQVFVLPFHPSIPWYVQNDGGEQDKKKADSLQHEDTLYALGLKREELSQQITYALWPDGTFAIAVLSIVALLGWPLLRLRYSTALEPITRVTALATVVSFIFIPGILCICAVWAWSRVTLINWADSAAENYARDIATQLVTELQTNTQLLERYRDGLYANYSGQPCTTAYSGRARKLSTLPVGIQDLGEIEGSPESHLVAQSEDETCETRYLEGRSTGEDARGAWSPLRTAFALGKDGASYGPRLTAFGNVPQRLKFKVPDREYFQALSAGEGWRPRPREGKDDENPWIKAPDQGFVAQRLFNRSDGARVLQTSVPRYRETEFAGVVAGDSRVYALTASVSPLLLRFAVVDTGSGAVLFHTDDGRSLVENFLVETEQNARLQAQLARRSSTVQSQQPWLEEHFNGRYLSEPHRFYVRPVSGVPWSVVVYYSTKQLGDVALQAGIAALATFVGLAAFEILIVLLLAYGLDKNLLHFASWLWPRWKWRSTYVALAWFGNALVLALVSAGFLVMGYGDLSILAALGALLLLGAGAYRLRRPLPLQDTEPSARERPPIERHYIFTLYAGVLLVSALPALFLVLRFHDLIGTSLRARGSGLRWPAD